VDEYLAMMAELRSLPAAKRRRLLSRAIESTGLTGYLDRPIGKLSKGYRQRVGLAQALLHEPELLILDEPTTGLDPNQIVEIRELIRALSERATIMLSTHILSEVEMTCERVLMIMGGKLRTDSRLEDLRAVNAAVVLIDNSAAGVEQALRGIDGVDEVTRGSRDGDYRRWRVTSETVDDLCPRVFDAIRRKDWRVAELRSDTRTLETAFRELAEKPTEALS